MFCIVLKIPFIFVLSKLIMINQLKTKNKITKKINIMKNTINQTNNNEVVNANVSNGHKPIFASADLWNIHKMVKGRVYRRYM